MKNVTQIKIAFMLILFVLGITINAQDKETKSKLDDLKGKVEKIIIKTDGKEIVLEGKDAEELVKVGKAVGGKGSIYAATFGDDDGKLTSKRIKIFRKGGDGAFTVVEGKGGEELEKKVMVDVVDGKKKISVTTKKDGKEETKTYEGDEAEKFIKENDEEKSGMRVIVKKVDGHEIEEIDTDNIFYVKGKGGGCECKCCCGGNSSHVKMFKGKKGNMMWKMRDSGGEEKEIEVYIDKKSEKKKEDKVSK